MASSGAAGKRTYHHGDLRRALIDAAVDLVAKEGVANLSLRAVARRAGVSTAAPYRHFASRDELLAVVAEMGFRELAKEIRRAMAPHEDPVVRLRESGVGYVRFAVRNPAHYRVMFERGPVDPHSYGDLSAAAADAAHLLMSAIVDCQSAGDIPEEDPRSLALIAWSAMHGIASLGNLGHFPAHADSERLEQMARRAGEALLEGIRRPATDREMR